MNKTAEKPSALVWKTLHADMNNVYEEKNRIFIDTAFDMDETWEQLLDEREFKECDFAKAYARDFAHGTAGHNRLMLIFKLCEILDVYEEAVGRLIRMADDGKLG